jgi:hypothetical protein
MYVLCPFARLRRAIMSQRTNLSNIRFRELLSLSFRPDFMQVQDKIGRLVCSLSEFLVLPRAYGSYQLYGQSSSMGKPRTIDER